MIFAARAAVISRHCINGFYALSVQRVNVYRNNIYNAGEGWFVCTSTRLSIWEAK